MPVDPLDLLPDGVVVADGRGEVVHANDTAERLLGATGLVGRPLAEVLALQDNEGHDWMSWACPYDGVSTRREIVEKAWFLADGTEVLVTARLERDGRAGPVTSVGLCLRSARARARLDRERSDLVATVAHELRSPLTGVKGFTATLLARWDKFNDDQKKMIMESVHTDTDRLTRMIGELLEVARIDTNRLSLYPRPLDAVESIERTVALVRAGTGREIVVRAPRDCPPLLADPDRFTQVITNLVENAVRHGEGTVRIEVQPPQGDADRVTILVEDEGEGIAPEIRRRVFTKFWKSGRRGGSGLGMYIVHGLTVAQGGTVEIADASGGGARIELTWPVARVDGATEARGAGIGFAPPTPSS
jgi:signal transduction histidine kinase